METRNRLYRLYIDESGDHTFRLAEDDNHRYLGLLGIWFDAEAPYRAFARTLSELKAEIFGSHPDDSPVCLHRKDIVERRSSFGRLRDVELNQRFESGLLRVVEDAQFQMVCTVIDKAAQRAKVYRELFHPYHYCLAALLERFTGWLGRENASGDVMAESRGRSEDRELLEAFEIALGKGTRFHAAQRFQEVLSSGKIKLKKKEHAIPGLELADLLVYPMKREMVAEKRGKQPPHDFSSILLNAARPKLMEDGKVWLD